MLKSKGFTLVELMVALVIGLVVLLGAVQIFLVSKRNFDQMSAISERQGALRYLSDVMSLDIRTASGILAYDTNGDIYDRDGETPLNFLLFGLVYEPPLPDDPYCASGESLQSLVYSFDVDASKVNMQYTCFDSEGVALIRSLMVTSGVEDVEFRAATDSQDEAIPYSVEVKVLFHPIYSGESTSNREFVFRSVRRTAVLGALTPRD